MYATLRAYCVNSQDMEGHQADGDLLRELGAAVMGAAAGRSAQPRGGGSVIRLLRMKHRPVSKPGDDRTRHAQ